MCRRTDSAASTAAACVGGLLVEAPRPWRDDLLDQAGLAVGLGAEVAQVPRLEAQLGELGDECGDLEVVAVVVGLGGSPADEPELLDRVEHAGVEAGRLQQLLAREPELAAALLERLGARQAVVGEAQVRDA